MTDGENGPGYLLRDLAADLQSRGAIPEVIVVAIGYDFDVGSVRYRLRNRDLTPTVDESFAMGALLPPGTQVGGAGAFLDFITNELQPFIARTYRVDEDSKTYLGHSFGGLFGLFALFEHSESFDNYVLSSPSIWYDDTISFRYEESYAATHSDLAKRVFISAGEHETVAAVNADEMYRRLSERSYPGLDIVYEVFEGEGHRSVLWSAYRQGLMHSLRSSVQQVR